jgi:hypothetical protein
MVPLDLLLEHLKGLLAVWGIVLLAGFSICTALRVRLGVAGYVLLGIVYWTISLYAFCFDGGLDVALGLAFAILLGTAVGQRGWRSWRPKHPWASGTLVLGCAVYATLLLGNYVPLGVDAGLVGTSARMISSHRGLPTSYAPWFPELFFPTVNLGLPTIGSIAISWGCEPGSVVLGLAQLAYSAWILAAYLVLRLWVRPSPAAILAVAQAWGARWAQNTISWGGFPTVAGMAVGLLAVRLLWRASRRGTVRSALALGMTAGAIPLVHGVSAAVWLYCVAPVAGLALLVKSPQRGRTLVTLLAAAGVSGLVLICYLLVGQVNLSQTEIDWSQGHIRGDAPKTGAWPGVVPASLDYLKRYSGSHIAWLGAASWTALLVLGRWRSALALAGCLVLLVVILANANWWILPFSMMLYPNRAVYWGGPLAAVAMALAWKAARQRFPGFGKVGVGLVASLALLGLAFAQHVNQYQRNVWRAPIGKDGWEALRWAEVHLNAPGTFVQATYGSVGSFLPSCAGVPTSAWQIHHCAMDEWQAVLRHMQPTHRLCVRGVDPTLLPQGRILFQNSTVTILDMRPAEQEAELFGPQHANLVRH